MTIQNESYWAVFFYGAVYYTVQGDWSIWVSGQNPKVSPFKWKLLSSTFLWRCLLCSSSSSSYIYLPSDFRVAYAASISEHLPTQPWEYTHKDQTTTPGTTSPTLCEQWVGSLTSHRVIYKQGLWDGAYGLSSLSEMLCKVVVAFESVDKILNYDHTNESYCALLSCAAVWYAAKVELTFTSMEEILKGNQSNESG